MNNPENSAYNSYRALGGIINEKDYRSALERADITSPDERAPHIKQAIAMARTAGIELSGEHADKKVVLYDILRGDVAEEGVENHHCQMSDQRLFAETLRMLGDAESLEKMKAAFPNIDLG